MKSYHNFIGIDIGRRSFSVSVHGRSEVREFENNSKGIKAFLKTYRAILPDSLSILEATGNCELELLYQLCDKGYPVHRADTKKVKNFKRSYGKLAKTDKIDALALAQYGFERCKTLALFVPQTKRALELYSLVQRRMDLVKMNAAEKNRLKAPANESIRDSCSKMITVLGEEIATVTAVIMEMIDSDELSKLKFQALLTVPGIGKITAAELLVLLPELGNIPRRQLCSLVGVAPIARESGSYIGYRRTGHGRNGAKPVLFMSAMAARRSKSSLGAFYDRLLESGKKKMVAIVALMRKILVIANARLRDALKEHQLSNASI